MEKWNHAGTRRSFPAEVTRVRPTRAQKPVQTLVVGAILPPMSIRIIGDHPLARDAQGNLRSRIATLFPRARTLVTLPGIHATQRMAYVHAVNADRNAVGTPLLTEEEEMVEWQQSVDLIVDDDAILIRPDPDNMPLAFEADDQLQELVSKQKIKFLHVMNLKIRQAIKERGESWRIAALPHTPEDMKAMIDSSRLRIGGQPIYYYNRVVGTRFLTYAAFESLAILPPLELAEHLGEIRDFSSRHNRRGYPEISFFEAAPSFGAKDFAACDAQMAEPDGLHTVYESIKAQFRAAVRTDLREDNLDNIEWRNCMFAALLAQRDETISEETFLGLSSEFYMQIEWLPGGRIEEGELVFDPIFDCCATRKHAGSSSTSCANSAISSTSTSGASSVRSPNGPRPPAVATFTWPKSNSAARRSLSYGSCACRSGAFANTSTRTRTSCAPSWRRRTTPTTSWTGGSAVGNSA